MADISNKLNKESENLAGSFIHIKENTADFSVALTDATSEMEKFTQQFKAASGSFKQETEGLAKTLSNALKTAGGAFKRIPGLAKVAALGPLGAITTAATLLMKQLMQVNSTIASISKDTGLVGKQLKGVFKEVKAGAAGVAAFNISLADAGKQAAALQQSLGGTAKVSGKLIDVTARIAKAMGGSAQESAALADNLIRGFGKTAPQVEKFAQSIMTFATKSGVNARKVMRDISNDSNLTAIYLSRGEDYMAKTAVMAAKMGKSMADNLGTTDAFLNIDSAMEITAKLNQFFGSNLNALKMHNLAIKQDQLGTMKELNKIFSDPKGLARMERMPGYAKQLGAEIGLNIKDMRQFSKVQRDMEKAAQGPTKEQIKLNKFITEGMNLMEQLKGLVASALLPLFTELGTMLNNQLKPMMDEATGMASAFGKAINQAMSGAKGLGPKLKAAMGVVITTLTPLFNQMGNIIGSAFMSGIGNWFKKSTLGKFIVGAMAGGKLGAMGGAAVGGMAGGIGAAPGALIGAIGGGLLGGAGMALGLNATGQVHSRPTLALVGEENRSEAVIPTERIRKGLPVSQSVSRELQSIGVPGYAMGVSNVSAAAVARGGQTVRSQSQRAAVYGSQGDPNAIRRREQKIEQQAAQDRAAQRDLVNKIMKENEKLARESYFSAAGMGAGGGAGGGGSAGGGGRSLGKTMHRMAKGLDSFMKLTNTSWKDLWNTMPDKLQKPIDGAFKKLPDNIKKGLTVGVETAWDSYLETGDLQKAMAEGAAAGIRSATSESGEFTQAAGNIVAGMLEGKSWRKGLGEEMSKSLASEDGSLNKALGKLNNIAKDSSRSGLAQAAAAGGASALTAGVDAFASTGSFKEAGKSALTARGGAAAQVGGTAALSATPLAPIAPLLGSIAGSLVSKGLGGLFGGGKKALSGAAAKAKVLGPLAGALRMAQKPGGEQLYEAFKSGSSGNKAAKKYISAAMQNSKGQSDEGLKGELINSVGSVIARTTGVTLGSNEVISLLAGMQGTGMQSHEQKTLLTNFERRIEGVGARGAIVNRPTVALIGEAGPEAVTPLDQTPGNGPLGGGGDLAGEIRQMNSLLKQVITNPPPVNLDGQRVSRVLNSVNSDDIRTGVATVNSRA